MPLEVTKGPLVIERKNLGANVAIVNILLFTQMLLFSYLTILRLTFFTKIVKSSMNLGSFLRSNKIVTWSAIFVSLYVHLSSPEPFYSSILIFSTEVKIGRTKKGISSYRRHLCFQSLFFFHFSAQSFSHSDVPQDPVSTSTALSVVCPILILLALILPCP